MISCPYKTFTPDKSKYIKLIRGKTLTLQLQQTLPDSQLTPYPKLSIKKLTECRHGLRSCSKALPVFKNPAYQLTESPR